MKISLMFHEVGFSNFSGFYNSKSYNYVISKKEFLDLIKLSKSLSQSHNINFEFSFDDGGISNLYSAEILNEYDIKGIFFIPTKYIGSKGFMNKNHILEIKNNGHNIGTHTHSHPFFLNKFSYQDQSKEWNKSIDILENILIDKVSLASAPNGFYNNSTFNILYKRKIKKLFTSKPSILTESPFPNFDVSGRMAIRKNSNNHLILSNNYFYYKKNLIRYNILKKIKEVLPVIWK